MQQSVLTRHQIHQVRHRQPLGRNIDAKSPGFFFSAVPCPKTLPLS
jgi:hypothetical protein